MKVKQLAALAISSLFAASIYAAPALDLAEDAAGSTDSMQSSPMENNGNNSMQNNDMSGQTNSDMSGQSNNVGSMNNNSNPSDMNSSSNSNDDMSADTATGDDDY